MKATREDELALRVAVSAARRAWAEIKPYYGGSFEISRGADGPSTTADRLADRIIARELQAVFPPSEYGYLSEETEHGAGRFDRERVWIIDPIDGTNDFIEQTGQFCMHIALVRRHGDRFRPVAALVYHPVEETAYCALLGGGAWTEGPDGNGKSQSLKTGGDKGPTGLRAVASRSHKSRSLTALLHELSPSDMVSVGSVGLKACQIALNRADFYVSVAIDKTKEWDSCAPHLVLEEAGGRMTDVRGAEIPYNGRDVRHRYGILATNGRSHAALVEAIHKHFANGSAPSDELRERFLKGL